MQSFRTNERKASDVNSVQCHINGSTLSSTKKEDITNVFSSITESPSQGFSNVVNPSTLLPCEMDVLENGNDVNGQNELSLHVQVRTRDGGWRSPAVGQTPLPLPQKIISNSVKPNISEGEKIFIPSFVAVNTQQSHEQQQQQQPQQQQQHLQQMFPATPASYEFLMDPQPPAVVHRLLYGSCLFVPFPQPTFCNLPPPPPTGESFPLFVGQVLFETTPLELLWLFNYISGVTAVTVESRGTGCFILHLASEAEREIVRQLHKRVLFDIGGVWVARSVEEHVTLCQYIAVHGSYLAKRAKLPRDTVVVEDIKTDSSDGGSCYPFFNKKLLPNYFFSGSGTCSRSKSKISSPTTAAFNSSSTSPLTVPLSPAHYFQGKSQNE